MGLARPYEYTEADREFDDALRRIRVVYRREDGSTDWDRFYDDVRKREAEYRESQRQASRAEGQDVRTGTDPA